MLEVTDSEGLPDEAERRRISERAKKSLAEARSLLERLDRLEAEEGWLVEEKRVPLEAEPLPVSRRNRL